MAVLPITKIGHPVLRVKASVITPEMIRDSAFQKFLQDMIETMHHADGVGLAANQVAKGIQVMVLECRANPRYPEMEAVPLGVYLNPRIIKRSWEREEDWEGCLSIPGYRGMVPRAKEVTLEALTTKGEKVRKTVKGFYARIIQHEIDHLQGFFYMDRMKNLKSWMHLEALNQHLGTDIEDAKS